MRYISEHALKVTLCLFALIAIGISSFAYSVFLGSVKATAEREVALKTLGDHRIEIQKKYDLLPNALHSVYLRVTPTESGDIFQDSQWVLKEFQASNALIEPVGVQLISLDRDMTPSKTSGRTEYTLFITYKMRKSDSQTTSNK